ncbi:DUF2797 domain-containing protein [Candidatus Synchoanobacter obligatus]|uniref:DUF2797 domain-containing protein n=1 Tax=Candidatus Synchoanobacter obligatus TaxID=2919597 RepID=A0ABT1L4V9_9GAMM|nr:DUF2797 domain-containing protein [Candidatus Synchoanobacter obligatus]MCP8351903.1 DUF2797 domain-containing protein [Candidatus Synchoanobacter obligatus]
MSTTGYLQKMSGTQGAEVEYSLLLNQKTLSLSQALGQFITIKYLNHIQCQACHKSTSKSFNQGFCYSCFKKLARNDRCVMSPELCHFAQGTCREPDWGIAHCMQKHIVYLSWTSQLKVGLTKPSQIPTRWIDQGATAAVAICEVSSRYHAGLIEDYLRQWYKDKTQWRKMLEGVDMSIDLASAAAEAQEKISQGSFSQPLKDDVKILDINVQQFNFPIDYDGPIKALSLDKQNIVQGYLLGIKGQYLLFDTGVFNIRKHTSYKVMLAITPSRPD